ncbi:MAG: hypothetical protein A2Y25_06225 [Candidatus Melainabacteria bacterium GWF2_37_15]|nr:MAG: hypothetical protein A2Y25_06225 [Candidatus Melainabacteria bacterium GWF2_37_15]
MSKQLKILFLGDVVGRPGRLGVRKFLDDNTQNYDFIIVNVENASHGYGLTQKNYNELSSYGIHAMTGGNHIWDRKVIFDYINEADKLIRPLNFPEGTPGVGSRIFKINEHISIGVINILGVIFMQPIIPPWEPLKQEILKLKSKTNVIIIDCHAEATAEKISCGYIAARTGASAVIGTHTHVQTVDEMIMENSTAYISDAGFCGSHKSIIGMEIEGSVERLVSMLPGRLEIGPMPSVQVNGVELFIDSESGHAQAIKRINVVMNLSDEVNE